MDDLAIRRPELRDVLRLGTVRWWNDDKGYGRITADDGEVLFAHFSGIVAQAGEFRDLQAGQRVCFVWRGSMGDHGRHAAEEVRVIGEIQPVPRQHENDASFEVDGGVWLTIEPPSPDADR